MEKAKPIGIQQAAVSTFLGLIVINIIALSAGFARADISPPQTFLPFIGLLIALSVVFLSLLWWRHTAGYIGAIAIGIVVAVVNWIFPIPASIAHTAAVPAITVSTVLAVVLIIISAAAWKEKT